MADQTQHLINRVIEPFLLDLSGIPICRICDCLLEKAQPQCELLCGHTFHTLCFVAQLTNNNAVYCRSCGEDIFRNSHDTEISVIRDVIDEKDHKWEEQKRKTFEEEVLEDNELLADLKIVKRHINQARKASVLFKKLETTQLRLLKEEAISLLSMLQSMKERRLKSLTSSTTFKELRSKRARANFYIRSFNNKYPTKNLKKLSGIKNLRVPIPWKLRHIFLGDRIWRYFWRMKVHI